MKWGQGRSQSSQGDEECHPPDQSPSRQGVSVRASPEQASMWIMDPVERCPPLWVDIRFFCLSLSWTNHLLLPSDVRAPGPQAFRLGLNLTSICPGSPAHPR